MLFLWRIKRRVIRRAVPLPKHAYKSGDSFYVWGEPLILQVVKGTDAGVQRAGNLLYIMTAARSTREVRETLLYAWLKEEIAARLPEVFAKAEAKVGRYASSYYLRLMKSRWGTCSIRSGRICINVRLAHLQPYYLDYVVTHELTHLWEPNHGAGFKMKMDVFYPGWRLVRKQLRDEGKKAF